jgi:hypothetical protein
MSLEIDLRMPRMYEACCQVQYTDDLADLLEVRAGFSAALITVQLHAVYSLRLYNSLSIILAVLSASEPSQKRMLSCRSTAAACSKSTTSHTLRKRQLICRV